jgi:hypothetical protein
MIARILGDGQYELGDESRSKFDKLDNALVEHVEAGDDAGFRQVLSEMIELVRSEGTELPDDDLQTSDVVVPSPSSTLEEVQALLSEEGLLPD